MICPFGFVNLIAFETRFKITYVNRFLSVQIIKSYY